MKKANTDNRPHFGYCDDLSNEPQIIAEKRRNKDQREVVVIPLPYHSAKFRMQLRAIAKWLNVDKWRTVAALTLVALTLVGCNSLPKPGPIPLPASIIAQPSPTNGAVGVSQPVMLQWTFVGQGILPFPSFDVLVDGATISTTLMATNLALQVVPDGTARTWQVLAHTQLGVVTGDVWRFTTAVVATNGPPQPTPAPVVTNLPPVPPAPTPAGLHKAGMFVPSDSADHPWMYVKYITVNGKQYVCCNSSQAYADCHGQTWEGDYRANLIQTLRAIGADSIVFYADGLSKYGKAFRNFVTDEVEDDGFTHVPNDENTGWQLAQAGIINLWFIMSDSPAAIDWNGMPKVIADVAESLKGARGLHGLVLLGTECNRNQTVAQVVSFAAQCRAKFPAGTEIWVGSSSPDFLKACHAADSSLKLWLEQASDPVMLKRLGAGKVYRMPLDNSTLPAYKAALLDLKKVGDVCAGEVWIIDTQLRYDFSMWCLQNGISCGCGQFTLATKAAAPASFAERVRACRNDTAVEALPEVSRAMHGWLVGHPVCAYCGVSNHVHGTTLNAHHIQPVMQCLAKNDLGALTNSTNFVSLCRTGADDHFHIGHNGNWSTSNPHVLADCAAHRAATHRMGWIRDDIGKHRRFYLAPRPGTVQFPEAFSLATNCPPPPDQETLGSCTANASTGAWDASHYRLFGTFHTPSRLKTYYDSRQLEGTVDQDAGAQISDVLTVLCTTNGGICPETMWPYVVSQFTVQPPPECYQYGSTNFVLQDQCVSQTAQDIKSALYVAHAPVIIGMSVYGGSHGLESQACATDGLCGLPSSYDQLNCAGGHCVLVVGWSDTQLVPLPKQGWLDSQRFSTGAFLVRNSWGTSWGLGGYFWLPYDYLLSPSFAQDFWAILRVE
jgi:hypothetical protein